MTITIIEDDELSNEEYKEQMERISENVEE